MANVVLDASALLALLNAEPGSEAVEQELADAVISAVNLAEVVGKLAEKGMPENTIRATLAPLALPVHVLDEDLAWEAGLLRPHTKSRGLSLGDRACLALGKQLGSPVLTADRTWTKLNIGVSVRTVR